LFSPKGKTSNDERLRRLTYNLVRDIHHNLITNVLCHADIKNISKLKYDEFKI